MHLSKMHASVAPGKGFCVNYEIMVGTILVLFNDQNVIVRSHGAQLAETYLKAYMEVQTNGGLYLDAFTNTVKPESIKRTTAAD